MRGEFDLAGVEANAFLRAAVRLACREGFAHDWSGLRVERDGDSGLWQFWVDVRESELLRCGKYRLEGQVESEQGLLALLQPVSFSVPSDFEEYEVRLDALALSDALWHGRILWAHDRQPAVGAQVRASWVLRGGLTAAVQAPSVAVVGSSGRVCLRRDRPPGYGTELLIQVDRDGRDWTFRRSLGASSFDDPDELLLDATVSFSVAFGGLEGSDLELLEMGVVEVGLSRERSSPPPRHWVRASGTGALLAGSQGAEFDVWLRSRRGLVDPVRSGRIGPVREGDQFSLEIGEFVAVAEIHFAAPAEPGELVGWDSTSAVRIFPGQRTLRTLVSRPSAQVTRVRDGDGSRPPTIELVRIWPGSQVLDGP